MLFKSINFHLASMPIILFSVLFNFSLHGANFSLSNFSLHQAIVKAIFTEAKDPEISQITKLVSQGCNPSIIAPSGLNAWEMIESLHADENVKKILRDAINDGLRIFLNSNAAERKNYLGDCNDPECNIAEVALYLSTKDNTKNKLTTFLLTHVALIKQLEENACSNPKQHIFQGREFTAALENYCREPLSLRNAPHWLERNVTKKISRYKRRILGLLDSSKVNKKPTNKKRKPVNDENINPETKRQLATTSISKCTVASPVKETSLTNSQDSFWKGEPKEFYFSPIKDSDSFYPVADKKQWPQQAVQDADDWSTFTGIWQQFLDGDLEV